MRDPSVSRMEETIIMPISFPVESYQSLRMFVLEKYATIKSKSKEIFTEIKKKKYYFKNDSK